MPPEQDQVYVDPANKKGTSTDDAPLVKIFGLRAAANDLEGNRRRPHVLPALTVVILSALSEFYTTFEPILNERVFREHSILFFP